MRQCGLKESKTALSKITKFQNYKITKFGKQKQKSKNKKSNNKKSKNEKAKTKKHKQNGKLDHDSVFEIEARTMGSRSFSKTAALSIEFRTFDCNTGAPEAPPEAPEVPALVIDRRAA